MEYSHLKTLFKDLCIQDKNIKRDINFLIKDLPDILPPYQKTKLKKQIKELLSGTPLAYVMGYTEFLNCKIVVSEKTLIPRPETELLCDDIIKSYQKTSPESLKILDLCSGSGCIGVSVQKALNCAVDAVEIDDDAIKIIRKNAKINNAKIKIIKSDMFEKINDKYDLIISNPPYIKHKDIQTLDNSVKDFEPHLALDGGEDGLKFYKIIAKIAPKYLKENGKIALEIGYNQANQIKKLLEENFKDIEIKKDYFKLDRYVFAIRR